MLFTSSFVSPRTLAMESGARHRGDLPFAVAGAPKFVTPVAIPQAATSAALQPTTDGKWADSPIAASPGSGHHCPVVVVCGHGPAEDGSSRDPPEHAWSLPPSEALRALASEERGLTVAEAARRLERCGLNELEEEERTSVAALILRQFRSPLIYILVLAGIAATALGELVDAAVIAAVLVINAIIGFTQEYRAEQAMAALRRLARATARVVRDGTEVQVDAAELVPGDVVVLGAGTKVPADCRILHARGLEVDESLLTGESGTVAKDPAPVAEEVVVGDRTSMVLMGTNVVRGQGRALVTATGEATELGQIAERVREIGEVETPLQRRMRRFAHVIGGVVLSAAALGLLFGALVGEDLGDLALAVVALAVSAIPEGLPIVLTVVLAIGVRRMASRQAIIRRLPAVETLGSCTTIGSDKTGTLTENRMTVRRILTGRELYEVAGGGTSLKGGILLDGEAVRLEEGSPLYLTLVVGALCTEASLTVQNGEVGALGDPTEVALLVSAAKVGLRREELERRFPRYDEIPFESELRYAATFHRDGDRALAFVKGAPERVLSLCDRDAGGPLEPDSVLEEADRMAGEGLRVLAMAYRELDRDEPNGAEAEERLRPLTFLGLQGMIDPPRAEAREAVRGCQRAGIRVLMITGDHATTAAAIAGSLGIVGGRVVTGVELEGLDDDELDELVTEASVYARVSPLHKLRIVEALQRQGETVAVTGDGVNDAPALRAAEIGAAMGRSGTDVAKEASDMVVADDNFASIFEAVREGRIAFDNVRKTTFFLVSSGAAEVVAVLASIALRFQLPFVPAQLLWLNLVTNGVQDIALAFEPGEEDVLERRPRRRREGILSRLMWERTALVGAVMATGTLLLFLHELRLHDDLDRARSVAVTTMVLFQVFHVFNSRSESTSVFRMNLLSNRFLFVGTTVALAAHVAALHMGFMQFVLRVEPLDAWTWLRMVGVAVSVIAAVELHKLLRLGAVSDAPARPRNRAASE
jgi:magnesium-transporting ATPase (P-type)